MDYIVYKTQKEKETIISDITNIRKFIYNDEDISCLEDAIKVIPYSDIKHDRGLVSMIKNTNGQLWTKNNITYIKRFDECNSLSDLFYIDTIFINMMFNNSGTKEDINLPLFNAYVYASIENKYLGNKEENDIPSSLGSLGVLAFSRDINPNINNDLVNSALYNRNKIKDIYEETMGPSSFDSFMDLCNKFKDISLNPQSITDEVFYNMIKTLKKFFYLRVDGFKEISQNDKNSMIIHFDEEYSKLVNKFEEEKEDFRSFNLRL